MRRWMAAPLVCAAAAALCLTSDSRATAQNQPAPAPDEETFLTADGIQLHGLFHKSQKSPGTDPVVIMLYPPGKDNNMSKGDWKGLADRLTKEGYNVFRFDWRGHGKSWDIKDTSKFWTNSFTGSWNSRLVKGGGPFAKPVKNTFFYKDLTNPNAYMPVYLTDLAAVRAHLDSKNDSGDLNSSSIYLVGSESSAAIGTAWLAAEWNRPAFYPKPNQLFPQFAKYDFIPEPIRGDFDTGGGDIGGCVWLSASFPQAMPASLTKSYITGIFAASRLPLPPKIRDNNPMMFLFAAGDKKGETDSALFFNQILVGKGDKANGFLPLNAKYIQPVQKADKLVGVSLLGDDEARGVEKNITQFLAAQQGQRKQITRKNRDYNGPYYVQLSMFGFP